MNMKKLQEFLPFATGEQVLQEQDIPELKKDVDALVALNTLGLIFWNKKDNVVVPRNSKNMTKPTKTLTEYCPKFLEMEISEDFHTINKNLPAGLFSLEKMVGDNYAAVVDSMGNEVLAIKFTQDTRSPWVQVDGDVREFDIVLTMMTPPNHQGFATRYDGWEKDENNKFHYDGFTVSDFVSATMWVLEKLGAKIPDVDVVWAEFSFLQRKEFIKGTNFIGSFDSTDVELTKTSGEQVAHVLINEEEIGTVKLDHGFGGKYRTVVQLNTVPENATKNRIVNAVNAAITNPVA